MNKFTLSCIFDIKKPLNLHNVWTTGGSKVGRSKLIGLCHRANFESRWNNHTIKGHSSLALSIKSPPPKVFLRSKSTIHVS